jgi:PAS domain-containing protein
MSSMQAKFKGILQRYGHNILLQRRTQDANPTYSDTLERHTVRFSIYNARTLPHLQVEKAEGLINTAQRVYYFMAEVNPWEGDRIYEEEFRTPDKQSVWVIDQAVPMRGINGEVIYWYAGATRIRPN